MDGANMDEGAGAIRRARLAGGTENGVRRRLTPAVVVLAIAALLAGGAGGADAKGKKADLKVAKATLKSGSVQPGAKLAVRVKVKNVGKRKARPSHVGLLLSTDRKHNRGDIRLAKQRLGKLKRRKGKATTIRAKLPKRVGKRQKLVACADLRHKVREGKEGNNCKRVKPQRGNGPGTFPLKPDPLEVTATTEVDRARSLSVHPVLGGKLEATGSDGAVYTLEIPKDALLAKETITITPVAAISDSPVSGGKLGAVEITPHGLQLQQPATLTIEPPGGAPAPAPGQTAFSYDGGGGDLHAYPLQPVAGLELKLTHFSTFGAAIASERQLGELASRVAKDPRAQYQQLAADLLNRQFRAGGPSALPELTKLAVDYYDDIVAPQIERALAEPGNDARVQEAIRELTSWERQVQLLLGTDDEEIRRRSERVLEQVAELLQLAYEEAFRKCTDEHLLDQIPKIAGLAHSIALLGGSPGTSFWEAYLACARFEVKLDAHFSGESTRTNTGGDHIVEAQWDYHVATTRIPVSAPLGTVTQWGEASWRGFDYLQRTTQRSSFKADCVNVEEGLDAHPGEVGITLFPYRNVYDPAPGAPAPAWSFQIEVAPGGYVAPGGSRASLNRGPYETYRRTTLCGAEEDGGSPYEYTRWANEMNRAHRGRTIPLDSEAPGRDLLATASIVSDEPLTGARETGTRGERTTVELWHTPAP